jgi:hypothetical protein
LEVWREARGGLSCVGLSVTSCEKLLKSVMSETVEILLKALDDVPDRSGGLGLGLGG